MAHLSEVVISFSLVKKKLKGDLQAVREDVTQAKFEFSATRERVNQLKGSFTLECGLMDMH